MHHPIVIGKHDERTKIFFKVQTQLSVKDLEAKQENHYAKLKLSLDTKLTNLIHTQEI